MWFRTHEGRLVNLSRMVFIEATVSLAGGYYVRAWKDSAASESDGSVEEKLTGPMPKEQVEAVLDYIAKRLQAIDVQDAQ